MADILLVGGREGGRGVTKDEMSMGKHKTGTYSSPKCKKNKTFK
jgi:hypothetical protein